MVYKFTLFVCIVHCYATNVILLLVSALQPFTVKNLLQLLYSIV